MRANVQLGLAFTLVGVAALLSGRALGQSESAAKPADNRLESAAADALIENARGATEEPDEITVQGRKSDQLGKYRLEMTKARDKIVETFNRVNGDNDTDISCRTEKPTGSRMGHSVCRSKAEDAADAAAAKGFLGALIRSAGNFIVPGGSPGGPQVLSTIGTHSSRQEGVGGEEEARANLEAELKKLMEQNRQLYRAVLEYVDARDNYNKARGAGSVVLDGRNPLDEAAARSEQAQP